MFEFVRYSVILQRFIIILKKLEIIIYYSLEKKKLL